MLLNLLSPNTVSRLVAGFQWDHVDKVWRNPHLGLFQVADLPGLLLQDVFGHRAAGGRTRPHLPPCAAQLHWSVVKSCM